MWLRCSFAAVSLVKVKVREEIMKYYQDITILPDAEADLGFLWQKVYQQIHIALVENKTANNNSDIAISFPSYGNNEFPLGNKLRVFSKTKEALIKLDVNKWLNRLTDYVHCKSIDEVPSNFTEYAYFKRKQFKSNIYKKAERRAKHLNKPLDEVLEFLKNENKSYQCKLPFINMNSLSKGEQFKLFIEHEIVNQPREGEFNCYGLSNREKGKAATIPWF